MANYHHLKNNIYLNIWLQFLLLELVSFAFILLHILPIRYSYFLFLILIINYDLLLPKNLSLLSSHFLQFADIQWDTMLLSVLKSSALIGITTSFDLLCSWWYSPLCNWPLLHGYIHNSVQLVVQQDLNAIFCRMAFCAAPTMAVLLHRFIPLTLGALQVTDYQYTSKHWPCPSSPGHSVNFPHSLWLFSVSYSTSMLLLAEQFMLLGNVLLSVGKSIIIFLYSLLLQQPIWSCCFSLDILWAVLVLVCLPLMTGVGTS